MVYVILFVDIILLLYKIPSMLLMILSVCVIIKEIKNQNDNFNRQFYIIIACKLTNEIAYTTTVYILFRIPRWGFYNDYMENNDWTARIFHVLATQQTTFMFLITFLISINRYIAVKYPFSYELFFSKSKIVIILLFSIVLSTIVGLGNIFFNPKFRKSNLFGYFMPIFMSKDVAYYQIFYTAFLFGLISIATCTFNIMAISTIKNHKIIGNKYKKELRYIIYSIFIFVTLLFVEAFFVCNMIAIKYEIKSFTEVLYFLHVVAFDLSTVGDFYFLIYSCNELRNSLKTTFRCSKKFNNKIKEKVHFQR
uniref:Serpentine receptor class gamma n=1 Tax=Strongyloides venezuelensis TaxID=75913 RepID=A0A0K0G1I0_STRVS